MWCKYCNKDRRTQRDGAFICCTVCGRSLEQDDFTDDPTFSKSAGGESRMTGVFVRSVQNDHRESFEASLQKGKQLINSLMTKFQSNEGQLQSQASNFYRIALESGFTRGRKTDQVAGACLYLACRTGNKPYLLIDFSIWLGVNVYILGAVYLQLCKLLSLEKHDFVQKLVDPSLFMHRFASGLMKDHKSDKDRRAVLKTALLILARMKRDWMQTGRKPSGVCGAALYIAALSHGKSYSKADVIKHVHVCEATLIKRLTEFENSYSGSLTIEELAQNAEEFEREKRHVEMCDKSEVLCKHKGIEPHFAHGLCRRCYEDFVELSGGLIGGSEPPSFRAAEMSRCPNEVILGLDREFNESSLKDETENLSDIDDVEVNCYLANEEESKLKKIIWEKINKEYLEEQAAKNAASGFDKKHDQRKPKRARKAENPKYQTAAEAARDMLIKKGLSLKINYECLDKLFEQDLPLSAKKANDLPNFQTPAMKSRREYEENPKDREENEESVEDEMGEEEEEEVYEDTTYDHQSEYYYEEDSFFDDEY